jgi:hypothetical protein
MAADLLERVSAELDARLAQLRPAVVEYERLLGATDMLGADAAASEPTAVTRPRAAAKPRAARKPRAAAKPAPARLGAGERAIVAALEHGSHTIGELGIVTAMSGADIRESARRLLAAGKIVRAKRDGRAAYALSGKA